MRLRTLTSSFTAAITAVSLQTSITLADTCKEKIETFTKYNDELSRITAKMESMKVSEISEEFLRAGNLTMVAMYAVSGSIIDNNCLSGRQKDEMIMINRALKERLR